MPAIDPVALDVYALKHTANVVRAVVSEDPDTALRDAYIVLGLQKLDDRDTAHVVAATLGNVLGIVANLVPEGAARQHLISRIEAVGSYADLLATVNDITGTTNRASRRKKGTRR